MGSSSSSARHPHDDTVDFGALTTQGVYTGPQDWNHQIVGQLIVDRRLAPYYRPLEDYEEDWGDEAILAARREQPNPLTHSDAGSSASSEHLATHGLQPTSSRASSKNTKSSTSSKDTGRFSEAAIYRGAVECPICFLYFPSNINRSRCCDHPICTECFVQIKRSEPSPTHLSSDPACCPYCVQDNFGVTYTPPQWRAGLGAESAPQHMRREALQVEQKPSSGRKKSFSADSPDVVTTDQIRPDWEEKLAAVRAAVQRRANRRIIMRQVGDRLIPVGVTSGRIHPIGQDIGAEGHPPGEATPRSSRRSRRNGNSQTVDINQFLGMNGQDLEELMVMEAMRLSLVEHEETQRNQARQANSGSSETGGDNGAPRGQSGTPDSENRSSTPQSFILPSHSTAAVSAATSIPRGRGSWLMPTSDTSQGQRRSPSSSHSATSPLAQAATSVAMGIGIPIGATSASRTPSRSPSPAPAVTATEPESTVQQPSSNGEAAPGVIHPSPAEASSDIPATGIMADNNPDQQVADFPDEPIVPSPMPITTNPHAGSDGVETETEDPSLLSPASSTNIPASYKALPSTPEDSIMTQPLIDKTGSVSSSTYQHGAAQYNGHAASQ